MYECMSGVYECRSVGVYVTQKKGKRKGLGLGLGLGLGYMSV